MITLAGDRDKRSREPQPLYDSSVGPEVDGFLGAAHLPFKNEVLWVLFPGGWRFE